MKKCENDKFLDALSAFLAEDMRPINLIEGSGF